MEPYFAFLGLVAPFAFLWLLFGKRSPLNYWAKLSELYKTDVRITKVDTRFQSLAIGSFRASCIIRAAQLDRGLWLATCFPFSLGYQPILIPWEEIAILSPPDRYGGNIQVGNPPVCTIWVSKKLFELTQRNPK